MPTSNFIVASSGEAGHNGAINRLLTAPSDARLSPTLTKVLRMSRPFNPDLSTPWKINLPATLAGKIEYLLLDPIHQKPIYASRNKLLVSLLEWWEARERGLPNDQLPQVPTLIELRERYRG